MPRNPEQKKDLRILKTINMQKRSFVLKISQALFQIEIKTELLPEKSRNKNLLICVPEQIKNVPKVKNYLRRENNLSENFVQISRYCI